MKKKSILSESDIKMAEEAALQELIASNTYLYAASCCQKNGYFGFQKFFDREADDERGHWRRLRDHMNDLGVELEMPKIEEVEFKDEGIKAILSYAYGMELGLLEHYEEVALSAKSVALRQIGLEFVEVQTKAVGEYGDLLARLDRCGANEAAILLLDQEVGGK